MSMMVKARFTSARRPDRNAETFSHAQSFSLLALYCRAEPDCKLRHVQRSSQFKYLAALAGIAKKKR
jgi:hypothetical protein